MDIVKAGEIDGVEQPIIYMRDLCDALIGKYVVIFTSGQVPFAGKLVQHNYYLVKLDCDDGNFIYLQSEKITAILEDCKRNKKL